MKTRVHIIDGASLERIEELASQIDYSVPDWVPYTVAIEGTETSNLDAAMVETQHYSGYLRELGFKTDTADGMRQNRTEVSEALDQAAERLDQAHQEWLETHSAKPVRLFMYWGYDFQRSEYEFATEAEKNAFLQGVSEGDGWQKFLSAELEERYEVVQRIGGYWENTWTDNAGTDEEEPTIFDNYTTAEKALNEHFADADAAKLDYDRRDFNIVPVGHF